MQMYPFPGQEYIQNPQTQHSMLSILSGGHIFTPSSFHDSPAFSSSILLLFTTQGRGRVSFSAEENIEVRSGHLLWHPCDSNCLIQKLSDDWDFYLFFLSDRSRELLPFPAYSLHHFLVKVQKNSMIPQNILQLSENDAGAPISNKLKDHQLLTDIFCECLLLIPELSTQNMPPASYLIRMKEILDTDYASPHSLSEFEEIFEISRYRICREFTRCYGDSPLQYLNKLRIRKSQELLHHTDYTIRETGAAVGIENTNHFINLFKKYTGKTPLVYRQEVHP